MLTGVALSCSGPGGQQEGLGAQPGSAPVHGPRPVRGTGPTLDRCDIGSKMVLRGRYGLVCVCSPAKCEWRTLGDITRKRSPTVELQSGTVVLLLVYTHAHGSRHRGSSAALPGLALPREVEYLVLRLKEVKGGNLSPVTRQSITDVVDLRNHKSRGAAAGREPLVATGQRSSPPACRS